MSSTSTSCSHYPRHLRRRVNFIQIIDCQLCGYKTFLGRNNHCRICAHCNNGANFKTASSFAQVPNLPLRTFYIVKPCWACGKDIDVVDMVCYECGFDSAGMDNSELRWLGAGEEGFNYVCDGGDRWRRENREVVERSSGVRICVEIGAGGEKGDIL